MSTHVTVLYFASLRDAAGRASESIETQAADLRALYDQLQHRHQLPFPARQLRVAIDGEFCAWDTPLRSGVEIAFIPPVSGG